MLATRTKRGIGILALALVSILFSSLVASAHGYVNSPISRQKRCQTGNVTGCGAIQWEPQSVEGPKGFPSGGPSNGKICSGGLGQFAELDNPRGGGWPTTKISTGERSFTWNFTAMHATTSYRYFITKNGWNGTHALNRSDLDSSPFLEVKKNGARPGSTERTREPFRAASPDGI